MKIIYRILSSLFSFTCVLVMLVLLCYGAFALWDNAQVVNSAKTVQSEMLRWKPDIRKPEQKKESFRRLRELNPDIVGWISMDGTGIDYPVLQGKNNLVYLNINIYGEFDLAGSVFLDQRNDPAFSSAYNLLYGHHMENGGMFGDLDRYRDEEFFQENGTGRLTLPDGTYVLQVYACLVTDAADHLAFDPMSWEQDPDRRYGQVKKSAVQFQPDVWESGSQTLALSTCASDYDGARTVVLARMIREGGDETH